MLASFYMCYHLYSRVHQVRQVPQDCLELKVIREKEETKEIPERMVYLDNKAFQETRGKEEKLDPRDLRLAPSVYLSVCCYEPGNFSPLSPGS